MQLSVHAFHPKFALLNSTSYGVLFFFGRLLGGSLRCRGEKNQRGPSACNLVYVGELPNGNFLSLYQYHADEDAYIRLFYCVHIRIDAWTRGRKYHGHQTCGGFVCFCVCMQTRVTPVGTFMSTYFLSLDHGRTCHPGNLARTVCMLSWWLQNTSIHSLLIRLSNNRADWLRHNARLFFKAQM